MDIIHFVLAFVFGLFTGDSNPVSPVVDNVNNEQSVEEVLVRQEGDVANTDVRNCDPERLTEELSDVFIEIDPGLSQSVETYIPQGEVLFAQNGAGVRYAPCAVQRTWSGIVSESQVASKSFAIKAINGLREQGWDDGSVQEYQGGTGLYTLSLAHADSPLVSDHVFVRYDHQMQQVQFVLVSSSLKTQGFDEQHEIQCPCQESVRLTVSAPVGLQ